MSQLVKFGDVVLKVNDKVDPQDAGLERYVAGEHMVTDDPFLREYGLVGDGYLGPAFQMRFKPGHILYGSRRTYLRKVAMSSFEGVCANTTFVLRPVNDKLAKEFLLHVMSTERFHTHSILQSKGSVNPYINFSDLVDYEFELPSLDEQAQIVELMTAVDEHLDALRSQLEVAKSSRAAVLHQLLSAGGDDWVNTTLGEISLVNPEATSSFKNGDEIVYIDLSSVSAETGIGTELFRGMYGQAPGRARRVVRAQDVLISTVRPYLRGFALVPEFLDGEVASTGFTVLRAEPTRALSGLIWAVVGTDEFVDFLMDRATGSSYPAVRPSDVSAYPFLLPPIAEQKRIVEVVSSMDDVIHATEQAIAEAKVLRTTLLNKEIS